MFEGIKKLFEKNDLGTPKMGEVGVTELGLYKNTTFGQYNPDDLQRRKGGLKIYDKMRVDDQVKASLALKVNAVLASGWDIEPASQDPADIEIAEFVKAALEGIKGTVNDTLREILTALDYGYSVSEIVWKLEESGDLAGKITIDKIKGKKPHNYYFDADEFGNLKPDGLLSKLFLGASQTRLPVDKFVIFTYRKEFSNHYGRSDLREAYRSWWSKDNIIKFWNIFLEKFGSPTVIGKYKTNDQADQEKLKTVMSNLQNNTSIAFKDGDMDISLLEAVRRGGNDSYEKALDYHDRGIARGVLIPDKLSAGGQTGAFALGKVHFDMFLWTVKELQGTIAENVMDDQIIKRLIGWNFANVTKFPKFRFNPSTNEEKVELAKTFGELVQKGAVTSTFEDENHIRGILSMPELDEEPEDEEESPNPGKKEKPKPGVNPEDAEPTKENKMIAAEYVALELDFKGRFGKKNFNNNIKAALMEQAKHTVKLINTSIGFVKKRKKTKYEDEVNFVKIEAELDKGETKTVNALQEILTKQRDNLTAFVAGKMVKGQLTTSLVNTGITLKFGAELKRTIRTMYETSYLYGIDVAKSEVPKSFVTGKQGIALPADKALSYFNDKADLVVAGIQGPLTLETKKILYDAIKTGEAVNTTTKKLQDAYRPYLEEGDVIIDEKQLTSYRLNAIVRTSMSESFNFGRRAIGDTLGDFLVGYQYSEIIDDRTVEISLFVDGKIISANHPGLEQLSYPLHWNERGLFVFVTKDEGVVTFMSDAEIAQAISMKGI